MSDLPNITVKILYITLYYIVTIKNNLHHNKKPLCDCNHTTQLNVNTVKWAAGDHAVAYQVPVCWSLYFNCIPLYTEVQLTTCIFSSNWCKMRLVLELPEHNA
jgi:hypothetical protein